jgi:hypothetical protein
MVMRALCHICCGRGQSHAVSAGAAARRAVPQSKVAAVTDQNAPGANSAAGAQTDDNDWRVTVRLVERGQASQAVERLSAHKVEGEVHNRLGGRVIVGTDGADELYLYTHSLDSALTAESSVSDVLASHGMRADFALEQWHPIEEEWESTDAELPSTPAEVEAERQHLDAEETSESLAEGHALFEVRVQLASHRDSVSLAGRLAAEGYPVVRRWRFLVVGANNADQAEEFAVQIRQEAPAGAVVTTEEVGALYPYTLLDAAAGSGL